MAAQNSHHVLHKPINVQMGWNEGVESKKDAIELAKGFIQRRYTALEASWFAVAPFMGGYLWEVHEGGPGKGYIGSVIDALSKNPEGKFWFPSGDRAFQVMMRDGKPFGILLSGDESLPVINSGQPPLIAASKMSPAVRKGTGVFLTGSAMLGSGALFMISSMAFFAISANPGPSLRAVDFSALPHAQWNQVVDTGVEEIVSKLEMTEDKWRVEKRTHVIPGLSELRNEGQAIIQEIRNNILPMPEDSVDDGAAAQVQPAAPAGSGENHNDAQQPGQNLSPAEMRRAAREAGAQSLIPGMSQLPGLPPLAGAALPGTVPVPVDNGGRP